MLLFLKYAQVRSSLGLIIILLSIMTMRKNKHFAFRWNLIWPFSFWFLKCSLSILFLLRFSSAMMKCQSSFCGADLLEETVERQEESEKKGRPPCSWPKAHPTFYSNALACVLLLPGLIICVLIITGKKKQTQNQADESLDVWRLVWGLFYTMNQWSWLLRIPFHNKYVK